MAKRPSVPKFGAWENQNAGYTMYFENVRQDKSTGSKFVNPNDPQEMQNTHFGNQSNIAPAQKHRENHPKPSPNRTSPEPKRQQEYQHNYNQQNVNNNYQPEGSYGAPPARSRPNPGPKRPTAVPKFGDWEAVNSNPAGGGYTMQFENLKKKKEAAKANPIQIPVEPERVPQRHSYHKDQSFLAKLFGCFHN
ncbi:hypothetical protein LUZ60_017118 [Juncus effusus]|nr:hypothetical protein LUZ60_017118 [Juncus effusus]